MKSLKWRIAIVLLVLLASLYALFTKPVNFGLDLQGGTHLVLQIDVEKALKNEASAFMRDIKNLLVDKGIEVLKVKREGEEIAIKLIDPEKVSKAVDLISKDFGGTFKISVNGTEIMLSFKESFVSKEVDRLAEQALETIRNRIDELGVAEPVIVRNGRDRIIVELPGVKDPDRAKQIIGRVAKLEFMEVVDVADTKEELVQKQGGAIPEDCKVLPQDIKDKSGKVIGHRYYLVKKEPILTGAYLKNAYPSTDEYGMPAVSFELNGEGARIFSDYSGKHVGTRLAIVLDEKVQSAPVIRSRIGARGQITGQFTYQEAKDLSIVLRAGALPAPVRFIEETTVGPSLGKESVERGVKAGISGLVIVMIFMIFYYKFSGFVADLALGMNVILLWAALGSLGATLTLPGIAGYILTIGMAVDANVIIFERIKEELKKGRMLLSAVEAGFSTAWGTIIDANITTIAAAAVLFQFGTGPIKGFAVTLSLGILSSMFTAVFVTKVILDILVRYREKLFSI